MHVKCVGTSIFYQIMAFLPGDSDTLTHHDHVRYLEKVKKWGCDPFELVYEDLEENKEAWPLVTDVDRMDYLVFQTNFTTKEARRITSHLIIVSECTQLLVTLNYNFRDKKLTIPSIHLALVHIHFKNKAFFI